MPTPIDPTTSDELVDAWNDPHLALDGAFKLCQRNLIRGARVGSGSALNTFKFNQDAALVRTAFVGV